MFKPLRPGDTFKFTRPVKAGSGKIYEEGNTLMLLEPTGQDPFGQGELLGNKHNWLVVCRYYAPPEPEVVWATIEHMLERGLIRRGQ